MAITKPSARITSTISSKIMKVIGNKYWAILKAIATRHGSFLLHAYNSVNIIWQSNKKRYFAILVT